MSLSWSQFRMPLDAAHTLAQAQVNVYVSEKHVNGMPLTDTAT